MNESEDSLMEMVYEAAPDILHVRWSDDLSVESDLFFQTIVSLFATIRDKQVANLMVESGIPAGGVLTEDIINYFIQNIPGTPLKRIAILESPDYLWDSNLYQVIKLLITTYNLPIAIELVKSTSVARKWFSQPSATEIPRPKAQ